MGPNINNIVILPNPTMLHMLMMYRAFEEESKARMGVVECVTHKLLDPFDVLYDKEGMVLYVWVYVSIITVCIQAPSDCIV